MAATAHTQIPATGTEAGRSLRSKPTWSTEQVPRQTDRATQRIPASKTKKDKGERKGEREGEGRGEGELEGKGKERENKLREPQGTSQQPWPAPVHNGGAGL